MTPLPHFVAEGPPDAPALLLGPSLGTSLAVWNGQAAALARDHRVIRWDLPGHGDSSAALVGDRATVADLAALVLALADDLGVERFAYAGISIGGAVGAELAVRHPDRVASLALICSSAHFGEPQAWLDRAATVRRVGTEFLAASAASRWFTPGFRGDAMAALIADQRAADPTAYAACCEALAEYDLRGELSEIGVPTLVIAGREDAATPPSHARELADGIAGAGLAEIPGAGHLAPVEKPRAVLDALRGHFEPVPSPDIRTDADRHAAGTAVRRAVLGDAHVDRAISATTDLTAGFQDFITRYAWGEIWTRPGLDRRTRSCITLTALVAGGHHEELAMHVRAAVRNGLSAEEIGEVLLHTAVYCGVPAANAAFAIARRTLDEDHRPDDKEDH
ncbi:MAG: 3-oxoadipate enol-lactonase [Catenulispora sp.]|nr:3-oxoadipate enol-lactonase [Catenulispora sp.]